MLLTYKYRESSRAGLTVTVHNIVENFCVARFLHADMIR